MGRIIEGNTVYTSMLTKSNHLPSLAAKQRVSSNLYKMDLTQISTQDRDIENKAADAACTRFVSPQALHQLNLQHFCMLGTETPLSACPKNDCSKNWPKPLNSIGNSFWMIYMSDN
ncbi:outer membrane protein Omp-EA, partial [Striga asiatica]